MSKHWSDDPEQYRRDTIRKATPLARVFFILCAAAGLWLGIFALWALAG